MNLLLWWLDDQCIDNERKRKKKIWSIFQIFTPHTLLYLGSIYGNNGCWVLRSGIKVQIFWKGHKNLAHLPLFFYITYVVLSKYKWKIGKNLVAYSEYLNFKNTKYFFA